jgi:hypothetical protein
MMVMHPFVARYGPGRRLVYVSFCIAAIAALGFSIGMLAEQFPYLASGIRQYVFNFGKNIDAGGGSLALRFGEVVWVAKENEVVLTGQGIGKGYHRLLESLYALYYYRYGLVGLLLYALIWGGSACIALVEYRLARRQGRVRSASFLLGFHIFVVALPITSLSSVITDQVNLYAIFYGLLAVVFGIRSARMANESLLTRGPLPVGVGGRPSVAGS